jgi:hypothetical protein
MVGGSWDNDELATLAHVVGMKNPGFMAQVAMGESGGDPNAVGHDDGGTEGLGLWQVTTGFNDEIISKYGGRSAMFNPILNAKAAAEILASSGTGAWYAPPTGARGSIIPQLALALRGKGGGTLDKASRKKRAAKAAAEKRKGKTGKGGGTMGPWGEKRKGERDPRRVESVPGLGPAPKLTGAAAGLGATFQKMLSVPGMGWAGKMAVGDFALEQAEGTETFDDDTAAQKYRIELFKKRKRNIQQQLARVNKELAGRMTKKQQRKLLGRREALQANLREVMGGISSARAGLAAGAGEGAGGEEGEETEAQRQAREAQEANTRALEAAAQATAEHTEAIKALEGEIKTNRQIAERESTLTGTVMLKALADMMANYLGPISFQHARVAGPGTVGAL